MLEPNREVGIHITAKAWIRDKFKKAAKAQGQRPKDFFEDWIKHLKIINIPKRQRNQNMRRNCIPPEKKEVSTPKQCPKDWMEHPD